MEISAYASRKLNILGGILVLLALAVRGFGPRSARGAAAQYALAALVLVLTAIHLVLQLRCEKAAPPQRPGTVPGGVPAFAGDFLALAGRHALLLLAVAHFDGSFSILYRDYDRVISAVERTLLDLALAELIVHTACRLGGLLPERVSRRLFLGADRDRAFLRRWDRVLALSFYIAFAFAYVCRFIKGSMYTGILPSDALPLQLMRVAVLASLLLAVWALSLAERLPVFLFSVCLLAIGFLHYRDGGRRYLIFALCVFIIAAAGKNARVILGISVIGGMAVLLFTYLSARAGIIEEYVAHTVTDGMLLSRHSFGVISPTDHAAHLLFITAALCLLLMHSREQRWYHCLAFAPMLFFYFSASRYSHARIASFSILLAIVVTLVSMALRHVRGRAPVIRAGALSVLIRAVFFFLSASYLIFFGWSCHMIAAGDADSVFIPFKDTLLSRADLSSVFMRIEISRKSFLAYPPSLLGNRIHEVGFGGGTNPTMEAYSFIDCSYVKLLLVGGILFTAALLFILTHIQFRYFRRGLYGPVCLLAIIALDCLLEHHIFEFFYNVFPLLTFAVWKDSRAPSP